MTQDLFPRFARLFHGEGGLPLEGRVLVAVSGGGDSVALLDLLCRLAVEYPLELVVGHLDHGLRPNSAEDADFVKALAEARGLPAVVERTEMAGLTEGGPEEASRKARRTFLETAASSRGCRWIALGHHQDDQAETFLLRLVRGSGGRGLSGMRLSNPPYVRPLLGFRRQDLRGYLNHRRLAWVEDETNADPAFLRNRVRHELLPLLGSFNPRIVEHLSRLCTRFAEEEDCWGQLVDRQLNAACGCPDEEGFRLPCELLCWLPAAFATRLVRAALEKVRGDLRRISATHVAMVQGLATGDRPQAEVSLPGAWVGRRYGDLWFRVSAPAEIEPRQVTIQGPGTFPLPDGRLLRVACNDRPLGEGAGSVEFAAEEIPFPLHIRTVAPGDRLQPEGMRGTRKLQDLYVDLKLTREQRQTQPLVVHRNRILWVVGVRRCGGLYPGAGEGGGKVLRLQLAAS